MMIINEFLLKRSIETRYYPIVEFKMVLRQLDNILFTACLISFKDLLHLLSFLNNWNYIWNFIILQKFKHVYGIEFSIQAKNLNFRIQSFNKVDKIGRIFNFCFFFSAGRTDTENLSFLLLM